VFTHLGRGATNLLASPKQLGTLLGSVLVVVAGGFLAREGAVLARQVSEASMNEVQERGREWERIFGGASRAIEAQESTKIYASTDRATLETEVNYLFCQEFLKRPFVLSAP